MLSHYLRSALIFLALFASANNASAGNIDSYYDNTSGAYNACRAISSNCGLTSTYYYKTISSNTYRFFFQGCAANETVDPETSECIPPACPDGYADGGNGLCIPPDDGDDCQDVAGYINGVEVCNDDANECSAAGGSLGVVDLGNGPEQVCVTPDANPPTCDSSGGLVIADNPDGSGGLVCESPSDNPNGTDNEGGSPGGSDPDTDVGLDSPESNPDSPPDSDSSSTDPVTLQQEAIKEQQAGTKQLKKANQQLGDINNELNAQSSFMEREEQRAVDRDQLRSMPDHTTTTAATFGDATQNFFDGLSSTGIVSAFAGVSDIFPSEQGSCPIISIDLTATPLGVSPSTDIHCSIFSDISTELGYICLAMYVIIGFRIIASA